MLLPPGKMYCQRQRSEGQSQRSESQVLCGGREQQQRRRREQSTHAVPWLAGRSRDGIPGRQAQTAPEKKPPRIQISVQRQHGKSKRPETPGQQLTRHLKTHQTRAAFHGIQHLVASEPLPTEPRMQGNCVVVHRRASTLHTERYQLLLRSPYCVKKTPRNDRYGFSSQLDACPAYATANRRPCSLHAQFNPSPVGLARQRSPSRPRPWATMRPCRPDQSFSPAGSWCSSLRWPT